MLGFGSVVFLPPGCLDRMRHVTFGLDSPMATGFQCLPLVMMYRTLVWVVSWRNTCTHYFVPGDAPMVRATWFGVPQWQAGARYTVI